MKKRKRWKCLLAFLVAVCILLPCSFTGAEAGETVRIQNADGVENKEDTLIHIYKELSFYEYPAVWIAAAALVVLLSVLIGRLIVEIKTRQMKRRQQEYRAITEQTMRTIANAIDAKDEYTNGHSARVAEYSREIARRMGKPQEEQENIYYMALLHDIGKIGIPDAILNKPDRLTPEEYEIMKRHTTIGRDILRDFTALPQIADGALYHHEKYDGSGYPEHRKGEEIPMVARIISVADTYDAMATRRAYREPMSREYILKEFEKFRGSQFEPEIVDVMIQMIKEGKQENILKTY